MNLNLKKFIGRGYSRKCYIHPENDNLCVKIALKNNKNNKFVEREMLREIGVYMRIKNLLPGHIAKIYKNLIRINTKGGGGYGIICELIRDFDGKISQNINEYINSGNSANDFENSLNWIMKRLIFRDMFFFDFNRGNFVIRKNSNGSKTVIFVDIKSLNRTGYSGFLHLERIFSPLARIIMFRRMRRMYKELDLKFPFRTLCQKKFFSTLFITVRPATYRQNI